VLQGIRVLLEALEALPPHIIRSHIPIVEDALHGLQQQLGEEIEDGGHFMGEATIEEHRRPAPQLGVSGHRRVA
jgi:hypothetical protein